MKGERPTEEIGKELAEFKYALEKLEEFEKKYDVVVCKKHEKIDCSVCKKEASTYADEKVAQNKFFTKITLVPIDDFVRILRHFASVYPDSWKFMKESIDWWINNLKKRWGEK